MIIHVLHCPNCQAPAPDGHIGWGHAPHLGPPILVAEEDLDAQIDVGRQIREERDLLLERGQIPHREALGAMRPGPYPIDIAVAGFDPDDVFA